MDIQLALMYCFLTMFIMYIVLTIDVKYICKEKSPNDNERIIRTSILSGLVTWCIIVYFIYNVENEVPVLKSSAQVLLEGKF
jgi:hypothetical protein